MAEKKQKTSAQRSKEAIVHLQLRVPAALHEQLRKVSFDSRRSQNELMLEALTKFLEAIEG